MWSVDYQYSSSWHNWPKVVSGNTRYIDSCGQLCSNESFM